MADFDLNIYLSLSGNCEAAFRFYEKVLGGQLEGFHTFASSPMANQVPSEWEQKITHASLLINGQRLMGADGMPGCADEGRKGFSLSLNVRSTAEADRLFAALSENGTVTMPLQETFWAERFGSLVDQFGVPWMINCEHGA